MCLNSFAERVTYAPKKNLKEKNSENFQIIGYRLGATHLGMAPKAKPCACVFSHVFLGRGYPRGIQAFNLSRLRALGALGPYPCILPGSRWKTSWKMCTPTAFWPGRRKSLKKI